MASLLIVYVVAGQCFHSHGISLSIAGYFVAKHQLWTLSLLDFLGLQSDVTEEISSLVSFLTLPITTQSPQTAAKQG